MLLFIDGEEHYTADTVLQKYTSGSCGPVSNLHGRYGKGVLNPFLHKALADPQVGSGIFRIGSAVYPMGQGMIFAATDLNSYPLFSCNIRGDGAVTIGIFGGPTTVSEPDIIRFNQWHYIEFGGEIDIVSDPPYANRRLSNAIIRVDGAEVINVLGEVGLGVAILPGDHSEFGWNGVRRGGHLSVNHKQDDLWVCDGSGPAPFNDFLGNHRIGAIFPNGVGFAEEWTPGAGSGANWERVQEHDFPNDDVDYVTASGDGPLDIHEMEDVDTNNTLKAIQILVSAKRSNDGFAFLTPYVRHAGVNYPLKPRALADTYYYRNRDILVAPASGEAWTDAALNALQAGYRRGEF